MSRQIKSQLEVTTMIARAVYSDLKPMQRYLLIQLSVYGDAAGKSIYPSLKALAEITGMSRSTVQLHIDALVKLGYVSKKSGGVVDGQNVNSEYQLNFAKLGLESPENVVEVDFAERAPRPEHFSNDLSHLPKGIREKLQGGQS